MKPILLTGATGYVGRRLLPILLDKGYRVRLAVRHPEKIRRSFDGYTDQIEVVQADALDGPSMERACQGCGAAYYLIHSMNPSTHDFLSADNTAAVNMREAAQTAGLSRIIYLTGLGEHGPHLSKHLQSRYEVERLLRQGTVPVTSLRAAMVIGSGSASFEILRYLVERLPVMITPRWVDTPVQPIAIRNVLTYLAGCLEVDETVGQSFDIGAPTILTYRQLMAIYAEAAGLPARWVIGVPFFTPKLSSYWIHLVTPVPASIARPLAEGLRNEVICREDRIHRLIPQNLLDSREAIHLALEKLRQDRVESRWTDAGGLPPVEWSRPGEPSWAGGAVFTDCRRVELDAQPEKVWAALARVGGATGWYYADFLWKIRGWIDRLFGGVGLSRGRRDADEIHAGEALDFWRVVQVEQGQRLLLAAEMKLPGEAVLEFRISSKDDRIVLEQRAFFQPRGLMGLIYWYAVTPFHNLVFDGMLRGIVKSADGTMLDEPQRYQPES